MQLKRGKVADLDSGEGGSGEGATTLLRFAIRYIYLVIK